MFQHIKSFFAGVLNTRRGILVPEELLRSILTSVGSGSFMGLILTILTTILSNTGVIFPNPIVGGMVTLLLTLLIDLVRRLNQGAGTPALPANPPAPAPTPAPAKDRI